MKHKAIVNIKEALTPQVRILSCYEKDGLIKGQVEHKYFLFLQGKKPPVPISRRFNFTADTDGNVTSTEDLF
jgi:hypothetical protein